MTIIRGFTLPFARFFTLLLAAGILSACSSSPSGPGGKVVKFKSYHLTPNPGVVSQDPAISFERKRLLHGAVTAEERQQRYGNYIDLFWEVTDRSKPVTLSFEFFQTRTGSELKAAEPLEVAEPKRYNKASYRIIGDDYEASGPIMAWKFAVIQDGEEVAKQESYLWSETLKERSQESASGSTTTIGGPNGEPSPIPSGDLQKLYEKGAEILNSDE